MKNVLLTAGIILTGYIPLPYAAEIDDSSMNTFTDGTPALADEVNSNFEVLVDAVNSLGERLASLESSSEVSNSISGSTYQLNEIGIINRGDGANYSSTANLTQQYTVTFSSNGTFQLSGTESEAELNTDNNELTLLIQDDPVTLSGTWSQSGSTVSTSEDFSFTVSGDGRILVLTEFAFGPLDDALESESTLVIGIQTN